MLDRFAEASDDWTRSALVAAATEHPADFIAAALGDAVEEDLTMSWKKKKG